ncbi:MAG: hypothetical protein ABI207_01195 [Crocinitomicaceae bacterium]
MKTLKNALLGTLVLLLASCGATAKFPTSTVAPASVITATKKKDKNKNYIIEVTAELLASPDRLTPPKNNYSVWIVTDNNMTQNVGQLKNKNAKTATLTTSTPFNVKEIFITAEDKGDNSYPSGVEISRTTFSK